LEERERAFKKMKMEKGQEEVKRRNDEERIKEEGRRLREQAEAARTKQQEDLQKQTEVEEVPELGPLDTTVRVKYALASHPTLNTSDALASLLAQFGDVDTSLIVFKPKKKTASALVPFKQIGQACAAVTSSGQKSCGLEGVEIGWAGGKNGEEPPLMKWLRKMGKIGPKSEGEAPSSSSTFSSFPEKPFTPPAKAPGMDYENLTLLRLRQAERERLEREILEAEARGEEV
jgi:DnaJ family protein C protein 17